jgi:ZIP family zinc transporter
MPILAMGIILLRNVPYNKYMLWHVFLYTALTALATGLGALPFLFVKKVNPAWIARGNALAAGAMLGASALLMKESWAIQPTGLLTGLLSGVLFIALMHRILRRYRHFTFTNLTTANTRKILMILGIMTLHSFTEGVGLGVSFSEGLAFGLLITLALAIHNIPEGLAISLVLVPRGFSILQAAGWSIFSSLPQIITGVPAFLFVEQFRPFLAPGLGFAAGAMIWMCAVELFPDAAEESSFSSASVYVLGAALFMIALEHLLP